MENIYLKTKDKKTCNGCMACSLVCPKHCIEMKEDNEGFVYPIIDENKCIKCGKCLRTCSNYTKDENNDSIAYSYINKDKGVLKNSASGGAFYTLAKYIFELPNSVCYGVAYNDKFEVLHRRAINLQEAKAFMGSKYIRSNISGIFESVKEDLDNSMNVLFVGTPCQVQGLNTYLNKQYANLITCDIICYSNPSPKVFKQYIKNIELEHNSKVKEYSFRSKSNGWDNPKPVVKFTNGMIIEEDTFQKAFSRSVINRPCCSACKFISPERYADITIGDLWGVDKITNIPKDIYKDGISLVLLNTTKAKEIFNKIGYSNMQKISSVEEAFKFNHKFQVKAHRNREKFFKALEKCKDEDIIKLLNKMSEERFARKLLRKLHIK